MIAATFLILMGAYLACGLVFAIPFALIGVKQIDPHAARGSWGFRLLIIPGTMAFWPLLFRRWATGVKGPPEECNAHRACGRRRKKTDSEVSHTKHAASCTPETQSLVTSAATGEIGAAS